MIRTATGSRLVTAAAVVLLAGTTAGAAGPSEPVADAARFDGMRLRGSLAEGLVGPAATGEPMTGRRIRLAGDTFIFDDAPETTGSTTDTGHGAPDEDSFLIGDVQPLAAAAMPTHEASVLSGEIDASWLVYKTRHIDGSGRVKDNGNGGISHSEGQGYAMVLAATVGDRKAFDKIWAWTKTELMAGGQAFAAWKWDPKAVPHITDPNNATDGDLLIAWGLALAADRWGEDTFRAEAERLARAIYAVLTIDSPSGRILLPGARGFGTSDRPDGPIVNLSYWVFPAFPVMARLTPDLDWSAVDRSGRELIRTSRFGPLQLPADWITLAGPEPEPAEGFDAVFGYNAVRIPLYLVMAPGVTREEVAPFAGQWSAADDIGPFVIDVTTGAANETLGGTGFKLISALTDCIAHRTRIDRRLLTADDTFYYPATLGLLALISIDKDHQACL